MRIMSKHSNQNYGETAELMKRGGLSIKKNICRRNDIKVQKFSSFDLSLGNKLENPILPDQSKIRQIREYGDKSVLNPHLNSSIQIPLKLMAKQIENMNSIKFSKKYNLDKNSKEIRMEQGVRRSMKAQSRYSTMVYNENNGMKKPVVVHQRNKYFRSPPHDINSKTSADIDVDYPTSKPPISLFNHKTITNSLETAQKGKLRNRFNRGETVPATIYIEGGLGHKQNVNLPAEVRSRNAQILNSARDSKHYYNSLSLIPNTLQHKAKGYGSKDESAINLFTNHRIQDSIKVIYIYIYIYRIRKRQHLQKGYLCKV